MLITLYKSELCPRCQMAKKYLREITSLDSSISVEVVDILLAPRRAWKDGVRMIPALKVEDNLKSGLYLNKQAIVDFISTIAHK